MKIKSLLTLLILVIFFAGVGAVGSNFFVSPKLPPPTVVTTEADNLFGWKYPIAMFPNAGDKDQNLIAYSDIRDPGGVPQGLPVRLKIPAIGVDTAIEDALITNDGRMDVPLGTVNVAWFSLGPPPGKEGSAVIGGHFGSDNGIPRVFYDLDKLKIGDKIYIEDDKENTLAFVVKKIELFDRNADSTTVFTSNDKLAHLNLITCEGVWNQVNDTYPDRRVVFTDAIPSEGKIVITKPKIVKKVAQANLPSDKTPAVKTLVANEQIATPSSEKSLLTPQILILSTKSLYATPLDGFITSLLLVSLVFIVFMIIRRKQANFIG